VSYYLPNAVVIYYKATYRRYKYNLDLDGNGWSSVCSRLGEMRSPVNNIIGVPSVSLGCLRETGQL
jgi:hypothetical protein